IGNCTAQGSKSVSPQPRFSQQRNEQPARGRGSFGEVGQAKNGSGSQAGLDFFVGCEAAQQLVRRPIGSQGQGTDGFAAEAGITAFEVLLQGASREERMVGPQHSQTQRPQ